MPGLRDGIHRAPSGLLEEHMDGPMSCPGGSEPAGDDWWLLCGHRRHAACLAAGLWEVRCEVRFDVKTPADALVFMLRENHHRRDLTPLEEAHGYEQLALFGLTPTKIAQQTRVSKKTVDRRLALNGLPDPARKRLRSGVITLADAEALLGLAPDRAEQALRSIGTKGFREEVTRARMDALAPPDAVAARLRSDYLAAYLAGTQRPPVGARDGVLRAAVGTLADALPKRTVASWCAAVGVGESIELSTVPPLRALIGVAVVMERSTAGAYDLLEALGYEPSQVELDLLERGA